MRVFECDRELRLVKEAFHASADEGRAHLVSVTGPAGTSATTSADLYKYKPPTVTNVSPNTGPTAGGTSVTITGSGFALGAATTFKFAAGLATSVNCSSTSVCTALSPPHAKAATVEVKAKVASFGSPKNVPADQFTYF